MRRKVRRGRCRSSTATSSWVGVSSRLGPPAGSVPSSPTASASASDRCSPSRHCSFSPVSICSAPPPMATKPCSSATEPS